MLYRAAIVDDEPVIRFGIRASVDWEKEQIGLAGDFANGEAAWREISREPVDILITDIKMPVMDGLELTRRTLERYPRTKVILVSSYSDFEYVREGLQLGVLDYLLKPTLEPEGLLAIVRKCLGKIEQERSDERNRQLVMSMRDAVTDAALAPSGQAAAESAEDAGVGSGEGGESGTISGSREDSRNGGAGANDIGGASGFGGVDGASGFGGVNGVNRASGENAASGADRASGSDGAGLAGNRRLMAKAVQYIQANFTRELTLRQVADSVHMSKNYFCQQFKRYAGENYIDYVIRLRIERAKELLSRPDTGIRIYEAAELSGFNDVKYFSKLFKRMTGLSPIDYRERCGNESKNGLE